MQIGDRFERTVRWTKDDIVAFARETGDLNPLHHDEAYAATTRFGGLIAAGGQAVAALMGILGSTASPENPGVGLEFTFQLRGAVVPEETLTLAWEVLNVVPSERPRGTIVELRGAMHGADGRDIVLASARTLMLPR